MCPRNEVTARNKLEDNVPNAEADPNEDLITAAPSALTDAELDALPEFIFDDRRSILWELCDDGRYRMRAADPVAYDTEMTRSLRELRSTIGSILLPLRVDKRPRDRETSRLVDPDNDQ